MSIIHILDHQNSEIVGWITSVSYDSHQSSLDNDEKYEFIAPVTEENLDKIQGRSRLLIPADEGDYREFIVYEKIDLTKQGEVEVYSDASYYDLRKLKTIHPQVRDGQTVESAAEFVLEGIKGWELGITEYSGIRKWIIDKELDAYDALKAIASLFDCEIRFRVTILGSKVTGRYVDIVKRVGQDSGKEIVEGKDLLGIKRRLFSKRVVTALICLGPEREDGTRLKVTVTDEAAFQNWNWQGQHLVEVYEPQSTDTEMTEERLTQLGEAELKKRITAAVEYEAEGASLDHIFGYDHEVVHLGDSAKIKDEKFNPPMYLDSRVIFVDRSIFDKSKKKYKLGEVIEYKKEDVFRVWKNLQELYATKVLKSPTPPEGKSNIIWIKTGGTVEIAHTWNPEIRKWIPTGGSLFTWVMYAENQNGEGISHSPAGKAYVGFAYNKTEETPSMNPTEYEWVLLKGDQGVPGPPGSNGQTPFFHTAWANNSTGTSGFSTTSASGKTYIGTYTDFTSADSSDPSKYTWVLIKGEKGDTGDRGPTGPEGPQGPTGPNIVDNTTIFGGSYQDILGKNYYHYHTYSNTNAVWLRIASLTEGRAFARFIIKDTTSGHHQTVSFEASIHYGKSPFISVSSSSAYGSPIFEKVRIVYGSTYDEAYVDVLIRDVDRAVNLHCYITDNIQDPGWIGVDWVYTPATPVSPTTNVYERLCSPGSSSQDIADGAKYSTDLWQYPGSTLINGGKIFTNSITANAINVAYLSALSADLGDVTAGNITGVSIISTSGPYDIQLANGELRMEYEKYTGNKYQTTYDADGIRMGWYTDTQTWNSSVLFNDGTGNLELFATGAVKITASAGVLTPGISTTGDVIFNNNALIASGSGTNTDHIWHDDAANAWNFVSDSGYKAAGNSKLVAGSLLLSGGIEIDSSGGHMRMKAGNGNYIYQNGDATGNRRGSLYFYFDDIIGVEIYKKFEDYGHMAFVLGETTIQGLNGSTPAAQIRNRANTAYARIDASDFRTVSDERLKENVVEFEKNKILTEFLNITPKKYNMVNENEDKIGLLAQDAPDELRSDYGEEQGINLYAMNTYLWKVVQELTKEVNLIKQGWHSHLI
jgi:phage minor structural protein